MHLYAQTKGSGPDLVLVHGWALHGAVWGTVADELARDFRLTCIDLPGHGRSPAPEKLDIQVMADLLVRAAPQRAIWLGWSLGGLAAMQVARVYPQRVGGLLTVAATPRFVQADDWPQAVPVEVFDGFVTALAKDYGGTVRRFLALQARGGKQARETLRSLRDRLAGVGGEAPPALVAGLEILKCTDLRAALADLVMPVHMLFGQRDILIPVSVVEQLRALRPAASIEVLSAAGHAPFISHPQAFSAWVRQRCETII